LALYANMEELVRIGAYARGADPEVDEAVRLWPKIDGFLARGLDPSRDLGLHVDIVSLYIVPPVILLFLAFTGRIISEHLIHALRASEDAIMRLCARGLCDRRWLGAQRHGPCCQNPAEDKGIKAASDGQC
jgi:hypothetical protein